MSADASALSVPGPLSTDACRKIAEIIAGMVGNVIDRRVSQGFDLEEEKRKRPFDYALVPEEIWLGAKFERSYVTSRGMVAWERIARVAAVDNGHFADTGHSTEGPVSSGQLEEIHKILRELERGAKPAWESEVQRVLDAADQGEPTEVRVISDLYFRERDGQEHFVEIKASLPNSDQTKVSKEKMLKLVAIDPDYKVYFALPDNPYLKKELYNHSHPRRWFDMRNDSVVVMAEGFWDEVVGKAGTFKQLIGIAEQIGRETKRIIREEYLGIEYGSSEED